MNDQAPLTLTLEEALVLLSGEQCYLRPSVLGRSWTILPTGHTEWIIERDTWPEAISVALGRPVVARDEAAELKAAIREWVAAYDDWQEPSIPNLDRAGLDATEDRLWAAEDNLRRLAGGEP